MTDLHNKLAWSVDEFSQLTGLSRRQINRGVREGTLPSPRLIGRSQRFFGVDLQRHDPFAPARYQVGGTNEAGEQRPVYQDPVTP